MANNNTGVDNSGDGNSGDGNSGDGNSGYGNSGYRNSGDGNSGYRNSGDWNSGYWNSGNWNSGDGNSGYGNSGYGNSANRSSGIFCSEEPTIRLFNRDTELKWDEIEHPHFNEFYLNQWIEEEDMTDEEKKVNEKFHTTGGYLKTMSWEEAWAKFWKETSQENREKILNLPNFDSKVFKDITGIDVMDKSDKEVEEAIKLLEKKGVLKDGKVTV